MVYMYNLYVWLHYYFETKESTYKGNVCIKNKNLIELLIDINFLNFFNNLEIIL